MDHPGIHNPSLYSYQLVTEGELGVGENSSLQWFIANYGVNEVPGIAYIYALQITDLVCQSAGAIFLILTSHFYEVLVEHM